jgi:hypothetical protein
LQGDELPNFDFIIEDSPPFTGLEKARAEAFQAYAQIVQSPATQPLAALFAEVNGLPPSVVQKMEKAIEAAKMMNPMGLPPGGPVPLDAGAPIVPPEAEDAEMPVGF